MSSDTRDDDGVGLIEIVVAMLLLAVLALGVLPLLIQATGTSVVNRDLVAANNVAAAELAPIRADFPNSPANAKTCDDLSGYHHDEQLRSAGLSATREIDCAGEGTGTVTVKVFRESDDELLVKIVTKVMVRG
ncbi:prepilin-type N-terminal cleavage/methylation domain-containing protein [Microbacterium sp. ARD32]|uniref:prepilin-type N-terminal cleavage/methylation domain-containing protein n=1 Tax=Microbacterium sp. ARD32 TaxID=2962577 RepID=UPI0028828613|nr:prepilin-type N-terminal cleavage/methylation domain-containing protein [Microbacterium sp. ARD32]MDT0158029.1 prepilin-type N-terminal cleavage/methylation domain-containing protein [Microbacterium sp. ARD32]